MLPSLTVAAPTEPFCITLQDQQITDATLAVVESLVGPSLSNASTGDAAAVFAALVTIRTEVRRHAVVSLPVPTKCSIRLHAT